MAGLSARARRCRAIAATVVYLSEPAAPRYGEDHGLAAAVTVATAVDDEPDQLQEGAHLGIARKGARPGEEPEFEVDGLLNGQVWINAGKIESLQLDGLPLVVGPPSRGLDPTILASQTPVRTLAS